MYEKYKITIVTEIIINANKLFLITSEMFARKRFLAYLFVFLTYKVFFHIQFQRMYETALFCYFTLIFGVLFVDNNHCSVYMSIPSSLYDKQRFLVKI